MWRQWYYQTCNEFGWYQTSNQPGEEFGGDNIAPLELSENYCQDAYRGDEVRSEILNKSHLHCISTNVLFILPSSGATPAWRPTWT